MATCTRAILGHAGTVVVLHLNAGAGSQVGVAGQMTGHAINRRPHAHCTIVIDLEHSGPASRAGIYRVGMASRAWQTAYTPGDSRRDMVDWHGFSPHRSLRREGAVMAGIAARTRDQRVAHGCRCETDNSRGVIHRMTTIT